jgi:hypothetical protein
MPRISEDYLDCVFYLYPDEARAKHGESIGGSGFLVAIPFQDFPEKCVIYAVTNRHVIDSGSTVIRLNTKDGSNDVIDLTEQNWVHYPDGDDLSVAAVELKDSFKFNYVLPSEFLSHALILSEGIGLGDETFTVGRFVNNEGKKRNVPSLRFGNIAQMPFEPLTVSRGRSYFQQESFMVEARSIPGFSGSPVFVHIPPFSKRPETNNLSTHGRGPYLLGIDYSHIIDLLDAVDSFGNGMPFKIQSNSGMMGVIPAWRLKQHLDMDIFRLRREELATQLKSKRVREENSPIS